MIIFFSKHGYQPIAASEFLLCGHVDLQSIGNLMSILNHIEVGPTKIITLSHYDLFENIRLSKGDITKNDLTLINYSGIWISANHSHIWWNM